MTANKSQTMKTQLLILLLSSFAHIAEAGPVAPPTQPTSKPAPNIVWILVDDMSGHFGYQGEPLVSTPNVDRLAREGVVFTHAYATAPAAYLAPAHEQLWC